MPRGVSNFEIKFEIDPTKPLWFTHELGPRENRAQYLIQTGCKPG
jgi:hypothetical protein